MRSLPTRHLVSPVAALAILAGAGGAGAVELAVDGHVSAEVRNFPSEPRFADQAPEAASPSIVLEPEAVAESEDGKDRLTVTPFLRLDARDGERTHADLRIAHWLHFGEGYTLVVGLDRVFWGVTESRHLVDVINQTDAVEDPDGEDKLGQPMVNLSVPTRVGTFDLFWLPFFRERTFAAEDARLRTPLPVSEEATFDSRVDHRHRDWAVRWSRAIGALDVGVAHFRGTGREPRFLPGGSAAAPELVPHYDQIDQTSLDVQWTRGAWLWKLEALTRAGQGDRFGAAVAGLEYTRFNTFPGRSADLGLLLEVLVDGRDGTAPPTVFDHDVFVGFRWSLNDMASTQVLGGPVVDAETGETLVFLEAQRRAGYEWLMEAELRWFVNTDGSSPASALERDSFLTVRLTRYL